MTTPINKSTDQQDWHVVEDTNQTVVRKRKRDEEDPKVQEVGQKALQKQKLNEVINGFKEACTVFDGQQLTNQMTNVTLNEETTLTTQSDIEQALLKDFAGHFSAVLEKAQKLGFDNSGALIITQKNGVVQSLDDLKKSFLATSFVSDELRSVVLQKKLSVEICNLIIYRYLTHDRTDEPVTGLCNFLADTCVFDKSIEFLNTCPISLAADFKWESSTEALQAAVHWISGGELYPEANIQKLKSALSANYVEQLMVWGRSYPEVSKKQLTQVISLLEQANK